MKKPLIKSIILAVIGLFSLFSFTSILTTSSVSAKNKDPVCSSNAAKEVKDAAGCSGNTDALPDIVTGILNAVIAVSGLVAVIFVIIGGVQYMTSTGDAGKVEKAKKTILYALIGLVVSVLAFAIVNWVIVRAIGGQDDDPLDPSSFTSSGTCANAGYTWDAKTKTCKDS